MEDIKGATKIREPIAADTPKTPRISKYPTSSFLSHRTYCNKTKTLNENKKVKLEIGKENK